MLVELKSVSCRYGNAPLIPLPDVTIARGQHTLLLGPSGSGKSTFLNAVTGLQAVAAGEVWLDSERQDTLSASARDQRRGEKIGLVMQRLHLISALSVRANLQLARRLSGRGADEARIEALATALGLRALLGRKPNQLSQGEAQRVAIARALVIEPLLLIADEPTSALDDANCDAVIRLLMQHATEHGATLLVATHDARIKPHFAHTIHMPAATVAA
jgi:putative ABC transport system ATP-binding protein